MLQAINISLLTTKLFDIARVAQLVEQRTENPRVGGSNPPPGTTFQVSRSMDRGSSDCFQTINVLEQELVVPWCG